MRLAHARVVDQLVFFMLPDGALDIERRFARNGGPTIAAIVAEEGHVQVAKGESGRGERNRQNSFDLRRLIPLVHH